MLREGRELLGWLRGPLSDRQRDESVLRIVQQLISRTGLSPEQKIEGLRVVLKRPRGRPADSRYLAVIALEAKVARPEATWAQITRLVCHCAKPSHDSYCTDNVERQVVRVKGLIRETGVMPLILATTKSATLRRNLRKMLCQRPR
jgi:hypothetical protein